MTHLYGDDSNRSCHKNEYIKGLASAFDVLLWPPKSFTVNHAIMRLEGLGAMKRISSISQCTKWCGVEYIQPEIFRSVAAVTKQLSEGLCLDCVEEGANVLQKCQKKPHMLVV